ncbi:hypothetical protein [Nitratiruptor sp. SB155-2]|uniref:hypothetical protein n=1 Tax=Nitratiruptor sp. (strain SB155-2) TaxID=387092 RepID=UPI0001586F2B|nr:hypothetical protein [Nitratiruptor sp. SB155-2]BAF69562.1 hypothetical protein NIS_0448 [Nitratiruptor sp. SB155-2]BAN05320.1 hypothetical protein [Nitratiruptor phage NrS-1]
MKNIQLFDLYSSYIFQRLYEEFPKCISIEPVDKELAEIDEKFADEFKKLNINIDMFEKNLIFSETILWLTNNGFITFSSSYPDTKRPVEPMPYQHFLCISLTLKGLNLLTSPKPKSINKHKKLGEEIVEKVKHGSLVEAGKMLTENMFDFVIRKGLE